jgi:enoyl-CoA hydratase/carnithine racemase
MPEITIGLFPDVGGSWLLGRMPGRSGLFLGLTGARIQAADALFTGMADFCIAQADKPEVVAALLAQPWTRSRADNEHLLGALLKAKAQRNLAPGPVRQHLDLINELCSGDDLHRIYAALTGLKSGDAWLDRAGATLAAGSPSTAGLTFALLRRARHLSLADVFRMEFVAALRCAQRPDLAEGIRALLIDKDQKPKWQPATLAQVTPEWVEGYFQAPWKPAEHPLADLR